MTFTQSVKTCFRKYFTFSSRASRSEFWWFALFCFLVSLGIAAIHGFLFGPSIEVQEGTRFLADGTTEPFRQVTQTYNGGLPGTLFSLATICPVLAAVWRRLHDTDRRGWMALLPLGIAFSLIAVAFLTSSFFFAVLAFISTLISLVFLLVMLAQKSTPGPNKYGPNPHEVPQ